MNFKNFVDSIGWTLESSRIIENFPDIILYIDAEGTILKTNQKARDCFKLLSYTTINEIIKDGLKSVRHSIKQKKSVLVKAKGKNNNEFYAEITASRTGNNYCISLRNKTQLIDQINEKNNIEKFNNEKNEMIYKIEDEFKSPINSIVGFSQGMFDGIAGELSEKQTKYLKIIKNNAQDLQEFVNKFIEFSYCESSIYEPQAKKIDIISAIKEITKEYSSKSDDKKLNISLIYDTIENRNIYFDETTLKKIISNILEVSLSLTEEGVISIHLQIPDEEDSIAFGLDEEKEYFQIKIKDTGAGIPPEEIPYLCNPYAQLEKGRKNLLRSLRLGIASILIKRSEAFIGISSDVMYGTLYNVIIPVEKVQDE